MTLYKAFFSAAAYFLMTFFLNVVSLNAHAADNCKRLPLNKVKEVAISDPEIYDVLFNLESSFQKQEFEEFYKLIHPALPKTKADLKKIFIEITDGFNLKKTILVRSRIFDLDLDKSKNIEAICGDIEVHGVSGPKKQYAIIYTYTNGGEQYRLFVILAPTLKEQKEKKKGDFNLGVVLIHTQLWSHNGSSPEAMIQQGREEIKKGNTLAAWIYATAASRILEGNPYVRYDLGATAKSFAKELQIAKNVENEIYTQVQAKTRILSLLGFTIVYQADGIEPGVRLQSSKDLTIQEVMDMCKQTMPIIKPYLIDLKESFKGVECLLYTPQENVNDAPRSGSKFYKWADIK